MYDSRNGHRFAGLLICLILLPSAAAQEEAVSNRERIVDQLLTVSDLPEGFEPGRVTALFSSSAAKRFSYRGDPPLRVEVELSVASRRAFEEILEMIEEGQNDPDNQYPRTILEQGLGFTEESVLYSVPYGYELNFVEGGWKVHLILKDYGRMDSAVLRNLGELVFNRLKNLAGDESLVTAVFEDADDQLTPGDVATLRITLRNPSDKALQNLNLRMELRGVLAADHPQTQDSKSIGDGPVLKFLEGGPTISTRIPEVGPGRSMDVTTGIRVAGEDNEWIFNQIVLVQRRASDRKPDAEQTFPLDETLHVQVTRGAESLLDDFVPIEAKDGSKANLTYPDLRQAAGEPGGTAAELDYYRRGDVKSSLPGADFVRSLALRAARYGANWSADGATIVDPEFPDTVEDVVSNVAFFVYEALHKKNAPAQLFETDEIARAIWDGRWGFHRTLPAIKGGNYFLCQEHSLLFGSLVRALGIPVREVNVMTQLWFTGSAGLAGHGAWQDASNQVFHDGQWHYWGTFNMYGEEPYRDTHHYGKQLEAYEVWVGNARYDPTKMRVSPNPDMDVIRAPERMRIDNVSVDISRFNIGAGMLLGTTAAWARSGVWEFYGYGHNNTFVQTSEIPKWSWLFAFTTYVDGAAEAARRNRQPSNREVVQDLIDELGIRVFRLESPVVAQIVQEDGRRIGLTNPIAGDVNEWQFRDEQPGLVSEIPWAFYYPEGLTLYADASDPGSVFVSKQTIVVPMHGETSHRIELTGTGNGPYTLRVIDINAQGVLEYEPITGEVSTGERIDHASADLEPAGPRKPFEQLDSETVAAADPEDRTDPAEAATAREVAERNEGPEAEVRREAEGNNSLGVANRIAPTGSVRGAIEPRDDQDYYFIEVDRQGLLHIAITDVPAGLDIAARVYNAERRTIINWIRPLLAGGDTTGEVALPGAGMYYVQVADYGGDANAADPYSMELRFEPGDAFEPNGSHGRASPVATDGEFYGSILPIRDEDWYALRVPRRGALHVAITSMPAGVDAVFRLHNGESHSITGWIAPPQVGADNVAVVDLPTDGRYYLAIADSGHDAFSPAEYHVKLRYEEGDSFEPNESFGRATAIDPTTQLNASILPLRDRDWYEFTVDHPGISALEIGNSPSNQDLTFRVYNAEGNAMTGWIPPQGQAFVIDLPDAGSYYVEVADGKDDERSSQQYSLRLEYSAADAFEPNNSLGRVRPVVVGQVVRGTILPKGDRDWYAFEVARQGDLEFAVTGAPAELDVQLRVHDREGRPISGWLAPLPAGGETRHTVTMPAAGRYFVELADGKDDARSTEPYSLTIGGGSNR